MQLLSYRVWHEGRFGVAHIHDCPFVENDRFFAHTAIFWLAIFIPTIAGHHLRPTKLDFLQTVYIHKCSRSLFFAIGQGIPKRLQIVRGAMKDGYET
jgi:hypothetical protein